MQLHLEYIELLKQRNIIKEPAVVEEKHEDSIKKLNNILLDDWEESIKCGQLIDCGKLIIHGLQQLVFSNKRFKEATIEQVL